MCLSKVVHNFELIFGSIMPSDGQCDMGACENVVLTFILVRPNTFGVETRKSPSFYVQVNFFILIILRLYFHHKLSSTLQEVVLMKHTQVSQWCRWWSAKKAPKLFLRHSNLNEGKMMQDVLTNSTRLCWCVTCLIFKKKQPKMDFFLKLQLEFGERFRWTDV